MTVINASVESVKERPAVQPGDEAIAARILADVRAYVPTLRARAVETEQLRRVPDATIADLDAMGVFKMCIPVERGGYASTPMQQFDVVAEVARGCSGTAWVVWVTLTATQWVGLYDMRFQDEVYNTPWVGPLTCGAGNPCPARRVPGGYMLKGRWPFCSGSQHTAFHHVGVIVPEDENPQPLLAQIPRADLKILDDWHVMGMKGSSSNTVVIEEEVFVPEYRVRPVEELFANKTIETPPEGLLFKLDIVSLTAAVKAGISVGIARAAVELFKEKSFTRKITHLPYATQAEAPVTHLQLGEFHCKLQAAELIARNNVARAEQMAAEGRQATELDFKRTQLDTGYVMQLASEITRTALRSSGASQIHENSPFQRLFRDAQVATMHAHTMIETCMEEFGKASVGIETQTTFNLNTLQKIDRAKI
ncbi:acyl-CoA dehydrogenase family protein [Novosphingobium terrae]|uniref:acyl-CoA dehydrogenase family protein n=1 Tax=Novosphingobium terrae TaxID=2726189 RepID=UPI0019818BCE|nr:acyl-CoA dehydrogenase family protein [Novosphingobium terrae]